MVGAALLAFLLGAGQWLTVLVLIFLYYIFMSSIEILGRISYNYHLRHPQKAERNPRIFWITWISLVTLIVAIHAIFPK